MKFKALPREVEEFLRSLVRDAEGTLPESSFEAGQWILENGERARDLLSKYAPYEEG